METTILGRIRTGLLEKRVGLTEWLRTTPSHKKQVSLGPSSEQAVHTHLIAIDDSIERVEVGMLGRCEVSEVYQLT